MMSQWSEVFDSYGLKRVAPNDKKKSAYVPSQEQKDTLELAGLIPADGGPAPETSIRVLGDPSRDQVKASYYRSKGHPHRERRMGREFISSWLQEDDEVLIGVRDGQIFVAKVHDPTTHSSILRQLRLASSVAGLANRRVQPRSDDGRPLKAEFSVADQAPDFTITMECGDGRRHTEYARALELILARLAALDAELISVRLATAVALQRAEAENLDTVVRPVGFALPRKINVAEVSDLRKAVGNAGAAIGRPPNTSGNTTKRIALHVRLESHAAGDAVELQDLLAGGLAKVVGESDELDHQDVIILAAPVDAQTLECLRRKYASATPEVKAKISHHIERGGVGDEVKRACGYRCQICESLGIDGLGFTKRSGGIYAEAHHVLPVSGLAPGSLGPSNVICVCPNHHRQIHYGRMTLAEYADEFVFTLDGAAVRVRRN